MTDLISENIQQNGHLVLDGAMATELEKRGIATNTTLSYVTIHRLSLTFTPVISRQGLMLQSLTRIKQTCLHLKQQAIQLTKLRK